MPIKYVIENKTASNCGLILEKIEQTRNMFAGFDAKKGINTSIHLYRVNR